jgi:hypothetical protein
MAAKTQAELDAERLEQERAQLAAASAALQGYLTAQAKKEQLYDGFGAPRVLVRVFDGAHRKRYFCVIDVAGIVPYRNTTAEERKAGILSLSTPAVHANKIEKLIESGSLALQAAAFATPGVGFDVNKDGSHKVILGPGDLAMMHYRTARAIRAALRLIDEDI